MGPRALYALTTTQDLRQAFDTLTARLTANSIRFDNHSVGYPGGHEYVSVFWRPADRIWFHSDADQQTRYRCWYGVEDPGSHVNLNISCEVNPPLVGKGNGCEGAFAGDHARTLYYLHTGRFGGRRINRLAERHFEAQGFQWAHVRWPGNNRDSYMIVLGALDAPDFVVSVARFVWQVEVFKGTAREKPAQ